MKMHRNEIPLGKMELEEEANRWTHPRISILLFFSISISLVSFRVNEKGYHRLPEPPSYNKDTSKKKIHTAT